MVVGREGSSVCSVDLTIGLRRALYNDIAGMSARFSTPTAEVAASAASEWRREEDERTLTATDTAAPGHTLFPRLPIFRCRYPGQVQEQAMRQTYPMCRPSPPPLRRL